MCCVCVPDSFLVPCLKKPKPKTHWLDNMKIKDACKPGEVDADLFVKCFVKACKG